MKVKKHIVIYIGSALLLNACNTTPKVTPVVDSSFADVRKTFVTKLTKQTGSKGPVEMPPETLYSVVQYPTSIGNMAAYLSVVPGDGKLHPAMIWITGGFGNDIGNVWSEEDADNDQSAAVIRDAGIVMMYPSQRGGNENAGSDETCFGEIDDILAAAGFLAKQKGIDPNRIYLGGHSTGGTKVLLAAECSDRFRAVFSFGPVTSVVDYGEEYMTFDTKNKREAEMRAPINWLRFIKTPVFVFEGGSQSSNIASLKEMEEKAKVEGNTYTHFYEVPGKNHFSALQPASKIIAAKIMQDDKGGAVNMDFTAEMKAIP